MKSQHYIKLSKDPKLLIIKIITLQLHNMFNSNYIYTDLI